MDGAPRVCEICHGTLFEPLPHGRLPHLQRCATCGVVTVRSLPHHDALRELYSEAYFSNDSSADVGYEDYASDRARIELTATRRLQEIERAVPGRGRLLDVGCALGFFVHAARERAWDAEGIDISEHAAAYARETTGVPARAVLLEDAGFEKGSFDAITMWDVIEHVHDPVATLHCAASLLRPGGVLALATPDAGSLVAKLAGPRWMGYKLADEHLWYFDRRTMHLALRKAGLEITRTSGVGKDISLGFFARRLQMYAGPFATLLGRGLRAARVADRTVYVNPHDIMLVIARKPG